VEALRASYVHADREPTLQVVLQPTHRLRDDANSYSEQVHTETAASGTEPKTA
jgi:hypothetical protein